MVLETKDIDKALTKKGFKKEDNDHSFYRFYIGGLKSGILTKVSHGEKEIDDFLIGRMAKQVKLDKKEFICLIQCSLTEDMYINKLREQGFSF